MHAKVRLDPDGTKASRRPSEAASFVGDYALTA